MNDEPPIVTIDASTDVRFSLRSLFFLMTATALVMALLYSLPSLFWFFWIVLFCAFTMTNLWFRCQIRVCEHGIVWKDRFLPWSAMCRYYWDARYPNVLVMGFDEKPVAHFAAKTAAKSQAALETLCAQAIASREPVPTSQSAP